MVNDRQTARYALCLLRFGVTMQGDSGTGKQRSMASDSELLRRIGHDLRSLYAEVIRQPLPRNIEAALSRIEREHSRAGYQNQRFAV